MHTRVCMQSGEALAQFCEAAMASRTRKLLRPISTLCELYLQGEEGMTCMHRACKAVVFKHMHRLWVSDDGDRDDNRARCVIV